MASSPGTAYSKDGTIDSAFEFGRKGGSGLVDEEDLSDEIDYSKYRAKLSHKPDPRLSYDVLYEYYHKNYDTLDKLDNNFNTAGLGFDWLAYSKKPFSISIAPDFKFKEKVYPQNKSQNYTQIKFDLPLTFKQEDDWSVKLTNGINNFDYQSARDQFKYSAKVEARKEFLQKALILESFYKFQYITRDRINNRTDRYENTVGGSLEVRLKAPVVKSLEGGIESGMDNTIVEEEREDSYDYKYLKWYAKTKYELSDRVDCFAKYTWMGRNYTGFNHDFTGFMLENNITAKLFEVKETSGKLKVSYLHKQFRFPYVSTFDLHDNNVLGSFELSRKDDWSASVGEETRFYDYPARHVNDKIYYIVKASFDKYLYKKSFVIGCEYKNTFKNFLHKPDVIEDVYIIRAKWKF